MVKATRSRTGSLFKDWWDSKVVVTTDCQLRDWWEWVVKEGNWQDGKELRWPSYKIWKKCSTMSVKNGMKSKRFCITDSRYVASPGPRPMVLGKLEWRNSRAESVNWETRSWCPPFGDSSMATPFMNNSEPFVDVYPLSQVLWFPTILGMGDRLWWSYANTREWTSKISNLIDADMKFSTSKLAKWQTVSSMIYRSDMEANTFPAKQPWRVHLSYSNPCPPTGVLANYIFHTPKPLSILRLSH